VFAGVQKVSTTPHETQIKTSMPIITEGVRVAGELTLLDRHSASILSRTPIIHKPTNNSNYTLTPQTMAPEISNG
jgi:hypothetical protein